MTAQEHNKTLGILFLVFGVGNLLLLIPAAIGVVRILEQIGEINRGLGAANPENYQRSINYFLILVIAIGILSIISSSVQIIAGFGVVKHKPWARSVAVLAAIMSLISFPIGTALGIYALWFSFGVKGKEFYTAQIFQAPPTPPQNWT
jgi:hypothetical protein